LQKAKVSPKRKKTKSAKSNLIAQNNKMRTKCSETRKSKKRALQKKEYQKVFALENSAKNPLPKQKRCRLKIAMKKNISQQRWKYLTKYIF